MPAALPPSAFRLPPSVRLFVPVLDNGQGDIKADFLFDFFRAFGGREIEMVRFSDSHPGRGRNIVAAAFLRSDCTHLLFLDGDIGFQPEDIARIFERPELPIVGGIYPLKCATETKLCLQTLPGHRVSEVGGLLPVARTGTGFLRIAREVFEAMKAEHPGFTIHGSRFTPAAPYTNHGGREEWDFFQSGVVDGEWLSEDWFFCDRARALGFEVLVDTEIQLWHEGSIKYPLQKQPRRLDLVPPDMTQHIEEIWTAGPDGRGEYFIPLEPPPATVLDLGANIGGFTEWACEQWPQARVTACEPHPDNATLFRLNTRHRSGRVRFIPSAVRAVGGHDFLHEIGNCGEGTFHAVHGAHGSRFVSIIAAGELESAEFVKIDTEGCELEILGWLDLAATRAIALEYHRAPDRDAIRTLLYSLGFAELAHVPFTDQRGLLKFTRRDGGARDKRGPVTSGEPLTDS